MWQNHEYQQTDRKWLTSGFDSSFSLDIADDTNMKSWLIMCVQTTYITWLRKGEVIVWWHGWSCWDLWDLRWPKVSRLVIVKIMTYKKKFPPPNKHKNQLSPWPPDQYWSDINLTLSCQLANQSFMKPGEASAGSPSRRGLGRRDAGDSPGTTVRSQQQLGKKNKIK